MTHVADHIHTALQSCFAEDPSAHWTIEDESAQHAGHAGAPAGGQSHFRVCITSTLFAGKTRLARHRMVHQALAPLLAGPIHALALTTHTPEEKPSTTS